jgi:uncharacterized protein (TIGR02646 family)
MIQITNNDLDKIALEHYEAIENYINNKKSSIKISTINDRLKKCFNKNLNFKKLILATPQELNILAKSYQKKYDEDFKIFHTYYDYLNNFTKRTFFLKKEDNEESYGAYNLINKLNITVCPYCNRNTIYNLKYTKKRTSELDHFYPKSKYPVLALSFYNLIPSCKICNNLKSDKNKEYINPYDKQYNFNKNIKFDFKIKDATFAHSTDGFKLICKADKNISKDEKRRARNNIQLFKLNDLYQNHKDTVLELIQKREIYPDSYIDELYQNYSFFNNREDVLRLITGGYVEDKDLGKRPLSKLIKDISEELELI